MNPLFDLGTLLLPGGALSKLSKFGHLAADAAEAPKGLRVSTPGRLPNPAPHDNPPPRNEPPKGGQPEPGTQTQRRAATVWTHRVEELLPKRSLQHHLLST